MSEHRCDPTPDPSDTPVSALRALRMVAAMLKGDEFALLDTQLAIKGCAKCCHEVANYALGLVAAGMRRNKADVHALERKIAELERETGWGSDG